VAAALLNVPGCGDRAGNLPVPPGQDPGYQPDRIGEIRIEEWDATSYVWARIWEGPGLPPESQVARTGDCALYRHQPEAICSQPCDGFCQAPGGCLPNPRLASAGSITVTGLQQPLVLEPNDFGYSPSPVDPPADLFELGAVVTARAAGGATPSFAVSARGVLPLTTDLETMVLEDDREAIARWVAGPDIGGARIQLALYSGWHGAPYETLLLCETDDDGELTISQDLIVQLPPFGGPSLFPAWVIHRPLHARRGAD
jgi:hypothetical protein